jgi:UDPglucose 6-dehydrogenase
MKLCVVGTGYVGLVSAACFAETGRQVMAVDVDRAKIEALRQGVLPIHEPGLAMVVRRNLASGRLRFTTDLGEGVRAAEIILIAVGTPPAPDGSADLTQVEEAAQGIGRAMTGYRLVVNKSTVPVGTAERVKALISRTLPPGGEVEVASVPEFLREGTAVRDTFHPDRVVIGSDSPRATETLVKLHQPFAAPFVITDVRSAELIKYAANAFLATKISFINEIAALCEGVGADVEEVAKGIGLDQRIGPHFLRAGAGYGGSCLPKDTLALLSLAKQAGCPAPLLAATIEINRRQRETVLEKTRTLLGGLADRTVAVLGLAFKPDTDDVREAPALELIAGILREGGKVRAYDPVALAKARALMGDRCEGAPDLYQAVRDADAAVLLTEWPEFKEMNLVRVRNLLRQPVLVDGRNVFEPARMKRLGFVYASIGRQTQGLPEAAGSAADREVVAGDNRLALPA